MRLSGIASILPGAVPTSVVELRLHHFVSSQVGTVLGAQRGPAAVAGPHLAAVGQKLVAHPGRLVAPGAEDHHVGQMQRALALDDPALDLLGRVRPRVALHQVGVLHRAGALLLVHREHAPHLPLVAPGGHLHLVALADAERPGHHHTSGASDTIFRNLRSRSSRATGPKTRVPTGSPASLISTAALSSKRM